LRGEQLLFFMIMTSAPHLFLLVSPQHVQLCLLLLHLPLKGLLPGELLSLQSLLFLHVLGVPTLRYQHFPQHIPKLAASVLLNVQ
jgi:hypothetical protein